MGAPDPDAPIPANARAPRWFFALGLGT